MNDIKLLHHYFKGLRGASIIFSILLTWAMLMGNIALGKTKNITNDIELLKTSAASDILLLEYFLTSNDLEGDGGKSTLTTFIQEHKNDVGVEGIYCVRVISPVFCGDVSTSIVVYEKEMLELFPSLFGESEQQIKKGCIVPQELNDSSGTLSVRIKQIRQEISISNVYQVGEHPFILSNSSTYPVANDFFSSDEMIALVDSEEYREFISAAEKYTDVQTTLIVKFKDSASAEDRTKFVNVASDLFVPVSFDEMLLNSKNQVSKTLKQVLPLPVMLTITALFSLVSITVLNLKKRSRYLMTLHLIGYSQKKICALVTSANVVCSIIPLIINVVFVILWPMASLDIGSFLKISSNTKIQNLALKLYVVYSQIKVSNSGYLLILAYIGVIITISCITVYLMLRNKNVITDLRRSDHD